MRKGRAVGCPHLPVLGNSLQRNPFCVGLERVALFLNFKLHEGGAGSVLLTAVPAESRPEFRRYLCSGIRDKIQRAVATQQGADASTFSPRGGRQTIRCPLHLLLGVWPGESN